MIKSNASSYTCTRCKTCTTGPCDKPDCELRPPPGSQAAMGCTCGQPRTVGVMHRSEGPCQAVYATAAAPLQQGEEIGAHHLTPESIEATIADLRSIADGTTGRPIEGRDWRTWASVLALTIDHLYTARLARTAAPSEGQAIPKCQGTETICRTCNNEIGKCILLARAAAPVAEGGD